MGNPNLGGRTKTTWVKGQSGNPRKRYARTDIKALARERGPEAIRVLTTIMLSAKQPGSTRVTAAQTLLDRGYGKPLQTIDITAILGAFDLTRLSDEQLEQWEELVHEAAGPAVDKSGLPAIIEGELRSSILEPESEREQVRESAAEPQEVSASSSDTTSTAPEEPKR